MKNDKKIMSEAETIKSILSLARQQGVEERAKKIILRFQQAIKDARNQMERQQIAALGIAELHKTIGCVGSLVVDGVEILPEDPSYIADINAHKNIVKLD